MWRDEGCCGALIHHLGRDARTLDYARTNIKSWLREIDRGGLDAIVVTPRAAAPWSRTTATCCAEDPDYAASAAKVSGFARDISEYISGLELQSQQPHDNLVVAYHSACSLQHGQKITRLPKELLSKSGFCGERYPGEAICVVVRRARTTFSSLTSRPDCATARSPTSLPSSRT